MGMLQQAAKAKHHKKEHKAPPPSKAEEQGPDTGGEQPDASEDDAPSTGADDGAGDSEGQGGAPVEQPQQPQDAQAAPGGDQGDEDQEDAGGQQGDQSQGGAPDEGEAQGSSDQETGQPGSPADDTGGAGDADVDLSKVPVSPALQEAYQRANMALMSALYENDRVGQAVIKGLVPSGPSKIRNIAMVSMTLFTQINKQLQIVKETPQIVLPFVKDIVAHVIDMGQQVKQIQITDQEAHAALMTALETVLRAYGVAKGHVNNLAKVIPKSMLQDHLQQYHQAVASVRPAIQKNKQDWHNAHLAQGQAGPQAAQPAGAPGAPAAGGAPPSGGGAAPEAAAGEEGAPTDQGGAGGGEEEQPQEGQGA